MIVLRRWATAVARRCDFRLLGSPMSVSGRRRGLRKLTPDQLAKARDDTEDKMGRIMLTFVGTAAFCALSLLSPDTALLLGGSTRLSVPLAGPVSFVGFMLLGPAVLIALRVYLQVYVEHAERLERLASRMRDVRAPTLLPLSNRLIQWGGWLGFYFLLPLMLGLFAWKAAVFAVWGAGLLCVAVVVSTNHLALPFRRLSPWVTGLVSASAAVAAALAMLAFGLPHRSFNLFRANLSDSWLVRVDLDGAILYLANLQGADLSNSNLSHANLLSAKLSNARLSNTNLAGAILADCNLTGAFLGFAVLSKATLSFADLTGTNLEYANLNGAYLAYANLTGAFLGGAHLIGTGLDHANLTGAELVGADLTRSDLHLANLAGTNLTSANLSKADLTGADLRSAKGLTQTMLDQACGIDALLPKGFTLKPCRKAQ